jgi:PTS system nitrogen regulatory IIA component
MLQGRIADLIAPERVVPMLKASGKTGVLQVLSRLVAGEAGLNEQSVLQSILRMERLTAFGVGHGVAVPHAVMSGISEPVGAFARLKHPVHFGAADERLVDLVFLLLAPKGAADTLLPLLSRVVRRLRDREVLKHLRAGSTAEATYAVLSTDSWRSLNRAVASPPKALV